ncbi:FBD-associated F-box protein At1g66310 [Linum perenne]
MEEKCCCRSKKARKRRRNGYSASTMDRLSDLPDSILYHILSFLDTKMAVQTSVLNRRWRCVWKYVPVLNLDSQSFRNDSSFEIFVDKVLSLHYQLKVNKISLEDYPGCDIDLYSKVIKYAISHDTQHLIIGLLDCFDFTDLFESTVQSNLKTLELRGVSFNGGDSCFHKLTTLKLYSCLCDLFILELNHVDLSVNFPCLVNLEISEDERHDPRIRIRICAPQLLNLKLSGYDWLDIDVAAPRLEIFSLELKYTDPCVTGLPKFSLPYVDQAEVLVGRDVICKKRMGHLLSILYPDIQEDSKVLGGEAVFLYEIGVPVPPISNPFGFARAMDEKCCNQLEKPRERRCKGSKRESTRLIDLPDSILHHILSFLDTRDAVQTSVLSRRWRIVWKYVPVLNLHSYSFTDYSKFVSCVEKALSLRYQLKVDKISFVDIHDHSPDLHQKVIQYAISHDARHLVVGLYATIVFADLFGSAVYSNLEMLELSGIRFNIGCSCFPKVSTLKLERCELSDSNRSDLGQHHIDLSVKFPCLVNLVICSCELSELEARVRIYAPLLLNLKLSSSEPLIIEVVAPRLEFFILEPDYPADDLVFPHFSLPYVDRADVSVHEKYFWKKGLESHLDLLCFGLHHAKSVVLRCNTFKVCSKIRKFLEQKLSSFTNLESLRELCPVFISGTHGWSILLVSSSFASLTNLCRVECFAYDDIRNVQQCDHLYKIVRKFLELNLKFFIRLESLVCVSIDPPKVVKYLVEGSAKPGATYKRSP